MDYENMTADEIRRQMVEEARLQTNQEITREKQLEILKLHNILFERYLKRVESDLNLRARILKVYYVLVHPGNIERYYNIHIGKFYKMFMNMEIEY